MPDDNFDAIPGVSESELAGAVRNLTRIPEISIDARDLFTIEVKSIVEFRAQSGWTNEGPDDTAAFLYVPYPRPIGEKFGASPVYDLKATQDPILGKLFFLNRDASSGRAMVLPSKPNELLEWLADNRLGDYPLVVVHRNAKLMYYRKNGSQGDARSEKIREIPPVASVEELEEALRLSHKEELLTPSICPDGVWKKGFAAKYVPGAAPEKAIQKMLKIALTSWFRGIVRAELEDSISVGRIDIRLLTADKEGKLGYWAILELKVVRSYHHSVGKKKATVVNDDENIAAVVEGIRQARAFGENRRAEAFVDVFDLRQDKRVEIFEHTLVVDELNQRELKPRGHTWPLFGSASDARVAGWS